MIQRVYSFIAYWESIRQRTLNYVRVVPADSLDWSPGSGEFTCRDLICHIAAAEQMFVGAAVQGRWKYADDSNRSNDNLDQLLAYLDAEHMEARSYLQIMNDSALYEPQPTLDGPPVRAWRLLMAMVEHEIHHRGQLAMYLALMGAHPPQIYGMGVEDMIARAVG
jgi:uncharacterized damage-inducible protein DinB